jgi:hypothetical protein
MDPESGVYLWSWRKLLAVHRVRLLYILSYDD